MQDKDVVKGIIIPIFLFLQLEVDSSSVKYSLCRAPKLKIKEKVVALWCDGVLLAMMCLSNAECVH